VKEAHLDALLEAGHALGDGRGRDSCQSCRLSEAARFRDLHEHGEVIQAVEQQGPHCRHSCHERWELYPSLSGAIACLLSIGIPAGTLLGGLLGWRWSFGVMSLLAAALFAWVRLGVPNFPGKPSGAAQGVGQVLRLPGLRPVLALTLAYVLAHNMLYTYVAPWLAYLQSGVRVDVTLLVFGLAALGGIWLTGILVDRWLTALVRASIALFGAAALVAGSLGHSPVVPLACIACWGLAFGGTATLFITASARAAGPAADLAQSMLVTVWNAGMAGGGLLGAALLSSLGAAALPWATLVLLVAAWLASGGLARPAVDTVRRDVSLGESLE
jgi:predicted MFS family arabinose efflux permease